MKLAGSRGDDAEVREMEFEAAIRAYKFVLRFLIFTSPSIHDTSATETHDV